MTAPRRSFPEQGAANRSLEEAIARHTDADGTFHPERVAGDLGVDIWSAPGRRGSIEDGDCLDPVTRRALHYAEGGIRGFVPRGTMDRSDELAAEFAGAVAEHIRVVGPVVPGSIVLVPYEALYGYLDDEDEDVAKERASINLTMMKERFGHDQFVVMTVDAGDPPIIVTGREELRAVVKELFTDVLDEYLRAAIPKPDLGPVGSVIHP